jgi:CubicO group peptidase (beta-lactamase class C family)
MIHWVLLAASNVAVQAAPPDSVDRFLRAQTDSGFSGVVWFATNDSTFWKRAYGNSRSGLDPDRSFWIASVTKSFTAAAVLVLAHRGALSLDDTLSQFFPETPPDKRGITIRQLLTHTAGFGTTYTGAGLTSRDAAARAILAQPLARPPGASYQYEDDSYELLAALIEARSGQEWSTFVNHEILEALGLVQTGFWCRRGPAGPVQRSRAACGVPGMPGPADDWAHRGANGMFSTASDLATWIRCLVHPPAAWGPVLGDISRPAVLVRREGGTQVWSGLGSRVYTSDGRVTEVWLSGNGDDGHNVVVRAMADGTIVVVLSSAGRHGATTWSAFIADRLLPRR